MTGYFDNAATTYRKPEGMYDYVAQYMQENGANVGRGAYKMSSEGGKHLSLLRKKILSLVAAPETKTVVILPSATVALNAILFGLDFNEKAIIYISHFEHNAILRPLHELQKRKEIEIRFLAMCHEKRFEYDIEQIKKDFARENPAAVIVSQVSNVFGTVAPVEQIADAAKQYCASTIVDAAQACGLVECNLSNIDYYVFAGHKTLLGPDGIGGFICNRSTSLRPIIYGGTGVDSANREMPKTVPERFEAGSINLMAVVGLEYSVDWIMAHKDLMLSREEDNIKRLYETLSVFHWLKIVTPYPHTRGIISCKVDGYTSDEFGNILCDHGIAVRSGLHCSPEAHRYIGTFPEGLVRFSVSCFTDDNDFEMLKKALVVINDNM